MLQASEAEDVRAPLDGASKNPGVGCPGVICLEMELFLWAFLSSILLSPNVTFCGLLHSPFPRELGYDLGGSRPLCLLPYPREKLGCSRQVSAAPSSPWWGSWLDGSKGLTPILVWFLLTFLTPFFGDDLFPWIFLPFRGDSSLVGISWAHPPFATGEVFLLLFSLADLHLLLEEREVEVVARSQVLPLPREGNGQVGFRCPASR